MRGFKPFWIRYYWGLLAHWWVARERVRGGGMHWVNYICGYLSHVSYNDIFIYVYNFYFLGMGGGDDFLLKDISYGLNPFSSDSPQGGIFVCYILMELICHFWVYWCYEGGNFQWSLIECLNWVTEFYVYRVFYCEFASCYGFSGVGISRVGVALGEFGMNA